MQARKIQILQSAKGIGDVCTWMILAQLPEIGKLSREKISKLVKTDQLWQEKTSVPG